MKSKILITLSTAALIACSDDASTDTDTGSATLNHEKAPAALMDYAKLVSATYEQTLKDAQALQTAILAFTAAPSESTLQSAQEAWLASRESYGQSEVFRFYEGPIDNETDGPEGQLNAWPLDEAYIDYVKHADHNMNMGLIADADFAITAESLKSKNEDGGEANIATGYHAIEFLLWGQDLNLNSQGEAAYIEDGKVISGQRPVTDYTTDSLATRRITYLETVTEILIEDLEFVAGQWAASQDNYRQEFEALSASEAFSHILTGMGFLAKGELSGERMLVALTNHDQEDEHSCFSDNTHRDIVTNFMGIYNVYFGSYGNFTGTGIREILTSDLQTTADSAFENAKDALEAIEAPFDLEISATNVEGNARVQAGIDALGDVADEIVKIAKAMNISNLTVE